MPKTVVFLGCSFTAGDGWNEEDTTTAKKDSPYLWTNLCHKNIPGLSGLESVNLGKSGCSNTEIFEDAVEFISRHSRNIDTVFCQWTAMPRYSFRVGFELWETREHLEKIRIPDTHTHDVNLNKGISWSREYLNDLLDRLRVLHHVHWEIVKVVRYASIIETLVKQLSIPNLFFINGLCPWDQDYFVELHHVKPESYTEFTKKNILNIDSRDDKDIYKLYHLAHQHYREAGSINESKWINLYDSFFKNKIDSNFDNLHPGIQSNQIYYKMIENKISTLAID